jgi:DNA-directed RNA polymerase subunit K/omega
MSKKKTKKELDDDEPIDDLDDDIVEDIEEDIINDTDEEEDEEEEEEEEEKETTNEQETETCLIDDVIENDIEYFDEIDQPVEIIGENVSKENRISSNRLSKYEMVRILGERTKQLTTGAKPMIKNFNGLSYEKIAEEEFIRNMIPFKIKRPMPSGKFEIWTLDELSKEHLLYML